jgi:hypothetical protein
VTYIQSLCKSIFVVSTFFGLQNSFVARFFEGALFVASARIFFRFTISLSRAAS